MGFQICITCPVLLFLCNSVVSWYIKNVLIYCHIDMYRRSLHYTLPSLSLWKVVRWMFDKSWSTVHNTADYWGADSAVPLGKVLGRCWRYLKLSSMAVSVEMSCCGDKWWIRMWSIWQHITEPSLSLSLYDCGSIISVIMPSNHVGVPWWLLNHKNFAIHIKCTIFGKLIMTQLLSL